MLDPILVIEDLVVEFPMKGRGAITAVDGIDLVVRPGEVVALVGESGCGKTTTANAVLGLVEPKSGSVTVAGVDIAAAGTRELKQAREAMQMIAQDPYESLNPRMLISDIVTEPLVVHGHGDDDLRSRALRALFHAGLTPPEDFLHRRPHELSGGQRQRAVIAAALSIEPRLIVADEPVSMLDVSVRAGILNLLQKLATEDGIAVLMITHDLSTVAAYCDRIAVMYLGKIVETGPTLEVLGNPQHPYTEALLSVVPSHDPDHVGEPILLVGETPDAAHVPTGCRFHPRCPKAFDECPTREPSLVSVGDGHGAACLLVEGSR